MAYAARRVFIKGANGSDAEFRAWGSAIATAIQALGWIYVADAGRINWLTTLRPAAANEKTGFEIYRAADPLQGSTPWFVRLDYGSSSGARTRPGLWIRFGTGTDGAGVLTGASTQATLDRNSEHLAAVAWFFAGDGTAGALSVCAGLDAGLIQIPFVFHIERSQAQGVPSNVGAVLIYCDAYSTSPNMKTMIQKWGVAAAAVHPTLCLATNTVSVQKSGHFDEGSIAQDLFYNMANGFLMGPVHGLFLADPASLCVNNNLTLLRDGQTRTYFANAAVPCYTDIGGGFTYLTRPVFRVG